MSLLNKTKSYNYTESQGVNDAVTWDESDWPYRGRSHRRAERYVQGGWNKIYCEESAEAIVSHQMREKGWTLMSD